ncbi:MAG: transglycosylase family protein [Nitriliruptorales bacterium]|nr:transglycosylase family protein [Nitriliruptorales bacterium]
MRKRVLFTALAVVALGGLIVGPVSAAHRTEVRATIHGEVQPILVETALRRERAMATVATAAASQAVVPVVPEAAPAPAAEPAEVRSGSVWDRIADCESGDWDRNGNPIPGTARWDYGLTFSHGDIFEGGPNFHPATWDAFRDADMPGHAGRATRQQQIIVAERVLAAQGWRAWPVCSRKLGLR